MEDFGSALLLFAVAGYVTLRHCANRTKFRWEALEWEQNVFESAVVGLVLFFLVRLIAVVLPDSSWWPLQTVKRALPFKFSASLVGAFVLGIGGGLISNLRWDAASAVRAAVRNHGGDLRIFLHTAAEDAVPVALTMSTRKVYVGFVMGPPSLREPSYVTLLPTISGYRDEATREVAFTTVYESVYEDLLKRAESGEDLSTQVDEFQIVLPFDEIVSANRYDNEIYLRYFARSVTAGNAAADKSDRFE